MQLEYCARIVLLCCSADLYYRRRESSRQQQADSMQQNPSNGPRAALAIAHPGHEVRIFGWLESVRPMVSILTDGSGLLGRPRLDSTIRLIESTGATTGDLIGLTTDRELYRRVVLQDKSFFLRISDHLAADWIRHEVEIVVGDAREGAIMAHDLWRRVIDRAVPGNYRRRNSRQVLTLQRVRRCQPLTGVVRPVAESLAIGIRKRCAVN